MTLLGHSLGCVVLWAYIDLFGTDRLSKLVLVDAPAVVQRDPDWTEQIVREPGRRSRPMRSVPSPRHSKGIIERPRCAASSGGW